MNDTIEKRVGTHPVPSPSSADDTGIRAPISPIDTEALLARCMGKHSFALSLLSELETTGIARVAEIERLASNGDFDALAEAAHSLKGAVATLAAEPLRALCAAIEAAGQARAEEQLRQLARQLDDEMRRCLDFIPVFRAGNAGNPGPRGRMVQR